jgi:hypothetical protein
MYMPQPRPRPSPEPSLINLRIFQWVLKDIGAPGGDADRAGRSGVT